jgi:hypothetical protein
MGGDLCVQLTHGVGCSELKRVGLLKRYLHSDDISLSLLVQLVVPQLAHKLLLLSRQRSAQVLQLRVPRLSFAGRGGSLLLGGSLAALGQQLSLERDQHATGKYEIRVGSGVCGIDGGDIAIRRIMAAICDGTTTWFGWAGWLVGWFEVVPAVGIYVNLTTTTYQCCQMVCYLINRQKTTTHRLCKLPLVLGTLNR